MISSEVCGVVSVEQQEAVIGACDDLLVVERSDGPRPIAGVDGYEPVVHDFKEPSVVAAEEPSVRLSYVPYLSERARNQSRVVSLGMRVGVGVFGKHIQPLVGAQIEFVSIWTCAVSRPKIHLFVVELHHWQCASYAVDTLVESDP